MRLNGKMVVVGKMHTSKAEKQVHNKNVPLIFDFFATVFFLVSVVYNRQEILYSVEDFNNDYGTCVCMKIKQLFSPSTNPTSGSRTGGE